MEELLKYLQKQRGERVKKVEEYNAALDELAAAQNKVDGFGDMGDIEGEIDELDVFISQVEEKIETAGIPCTATDSGLGGETYGEGEGSEGGVDGVVVTEEA